MFYDWEDLNVIYQIGIVKGYMFKKNYCEVLFMLRMKLTIFQDHYVKICYSFDVCMHLNIYIIN